MPIVPISPPQAVASAGGFDYVAVDAARRRMYAAQLRPAPCSSSTLIRERYCRRLASDRFTAWRSTDAQGTCSRETAKRERSPKSIPRRMSFCAA